MTRRAFVSAILTLTAACSSGPTAPIPIAELPDIDTAAALRHIQTLASDEFEGRAPGSPGEQKTVQYLIDQFKALGLQPGNPDGTYVQKVPLVGITPSDFTPLAEFEQFERDLTEAGVPHTMIVYEGAPHSFFDRTFEEHRAACDDAWRQMLAFVGKPAPA